MRLLISLLFVAVSAFPGFRVSAFPGDSVVVDHVARPVTAATIQAGLDADGFFFVPPGRHTIDAPIRLTHGMHLTGAGFASVLVYAPPDPQAAPWAILFGDTNEANYGCYLDDVSISGGGVWCRRFANHCGMSRVWITRSPGDGLRIEGLGDKFLVRDVVAWENGGAGIVVRAGGGTHNGITLDHCTATLNKREGVLLETVSWAGQLVNTVLRDCTIQGNGRGEAGTAEILLRGWVHKTKLDGTHVEGTRKPGSAGAGSTTGVRAEPSVPLLMPGSLTPVTRRPAELWIGGASAIHGLPVAMELVVLNNAIVIDECTVLSYARIHWKATAGGGDSTHTKRPTGAMRGVKAEQIIADPRLE